MAHMRLVVSQPQFRFRGSVLSYCQLRIWRSGPLGDPTTRAVIIATDPDTSDAGTSITNAAEAWAGAARKQHLAGMPLERIVFIEHYPHEREPGVDESFATVAFSDAGGGRLHSPGWQHIERIWVEAAIGAPLD